MKKINVNGIFSNLAVKAKHLPKRTETGIGALMPWADKLWFVTYVAHKRGSGDGTGLFYIDDEFNLYKHPESRVGTYANRMIHNESNKLIIGPHTIDIDGNVSTFEELVDIRLAGVARHLNEPERKVYFLGMEGELFEADVYTLKVNFILDLNKALDIEGRPHFKDIYTNHGKVFVVNNSYYYEDFKKNESDGRLAEWDGKNWKIIAKTQFNTLAGRCKGSLGQAVYAVGQDKASVLFYVYLPETGWTKYRLPRATHTQDHAWTTEWPRIREVESERWLMDAGGMFYELPVMTYDNKVWGIVPICRHLRIIPDFCSWNGFLVLAGDQTTPINDDNPFVGQPQANLWFGKTDDLWHFGGKPAGWGGPWWENKVKEGEVSDPFLIYGFDKICLHISYKEKGRKKFLIEVDFMGNGKWEKFIEIETNSNYTFYNFPYGFSSHWIRIISYDKVTVSAQFFYS
ncbi:MAG: hypothetical protein ACK4F0_05640 [Candidatus Ratteibacteria bacterium]